MSKSDDDYSIEAPEGLSPAALAVFTIGESAVAQDETIAITTGKLKSTGEPVEIIIKILSVDGKTMAAAPIAIVPIGKSLVELVVPDHEHKVVSSSDFANVNRKFH